MTTLDLRRFPAQPAGARLTELMVLVSRVTGVSWDAWRADGRWVLKSERGDRHVTREPDLRQAIADATGLHVTR